MDRRTAISVLGGGLAAMAGCLGGRGAPAASPSATQAGTAAPGPLEVVDASAPRTAQVTVGYPLTVTVRNPTNRPATFRSPVSTNLLYGNGWSVRGSPIEGRVPATTTRDLSLSLPAFDYLGFYGVRLDATGREWRVDTVPRRLSFGDAFLVPSDLEIAVDQVESTDSYTGVPSSTRPPVEAEPGRKWAVVRGAIRNLADVPVQFPGWESFTLVAAGDRWNHDVLPAGDRAVLDPGEYRIAVPFSIPADASLDDPAVEWRAAVAQGETGTIWRAGRSDR